MIIILSTTEVFWSQKHIFCRYETNKTKNGDEYWNMYRESLRCRILAVSCYFFFICLSIDDLLFLCSSLKYCKNLHRYCVCKKCSNKLKEFSTEQLYLCSIFLKLIKNKENEKKKRCIEQLWNRQTLNSEYWILYWFYEFIRISFFFCSSKNDTKSVNITKQKKNKEKSNERIYPNAFHLDFYSHMFCQVMRINHWI